MGSRRLEEGEREVRGWAGLEEGREEREGAWTLEKLRDDNVQDMLHLDEIRA